MKNKILEEQKKGNIVISTFDGLQVIPLKEIIKQPIDGLLYDLNRDEATVLKFINFNPKWTNDYAIMQVIRELKRQLDEKFPNDKEIKAEINKSYRAFSETQREEFTQLWKECIEWLKGYMLKR